MKNLIHNNHFANLLLGINERFPSTAAGQAPDLSALKAAIKGVISNNNSLDSSFQKPIRKSAPPSFQYTPPAELPEKFSEKKSGFDYRKGEKPVYGNGRNHTEMSENEILRRLNQLLAENEVSGLNSDELAEVSTLQKRVR